MRVSAEGPGRQYFTVDASRTTTKVSPGTSIAVPVTFRPGGQVTKIDDKVCYLLIRSNAEWRPAVSSKSCSLVVVGSSLTVVHVRHFSQVVVSTATGTVIVPIRVRLPRAAPEYVGPYVSSSMRIDSLEHDVTDIQQMSTLDWFLSAVLGRPISTSKIRRGLRCAGQWRCLVRLL